MTPTITADSRYLDDFRKIEEAPGGPPWLRELRRQAWRRFSELGFPTARRGNEKWKYTDVRPIAKADFEYPHGPLPTVGAADLSRIAPGDPLWSRLVFIDGRYSEALSSPPAAGKVRISSLAQAMLSDGSVIERHLARHAALEDDAFVALNTAFLTDGAYIYIPDDESMATPLHLLFVSSKPGFVSHPRTLLVTGRNSKTTIIETYAALTEDRYFANAVTEIVASEGSQVEHYRLLLEGDAAFHVGVTRFDQSQESTVNSTFFARGSAIARNDSLTSLNGSGSSAHLRGLYVTEGNEHIDNHINIDHAAPHTTSRLFYKGILDGKSQAIFGGRVLVRPGAIKTDAQQTDKNLLLSAEAEVNSKPSLEIYADDVQCGHGATAGAIAEEALFYMRARGLDPETATAFLIKGFASEILDSVGIPSLRDYLERLILGRIPAVAIGAGS